jgi:hypothetical protein
MNAKAILFGGMLVALGAAVVIGQRTNAALRNEQASLLPTANEIRQLRRATSLALPPVDPQELEQLRAKTRDLHALRNAAGHLQREKLARENAPATPSTRPSPLATLLDFVSKDSVAYAGFATPENSLRSYFAAIFKGDVPHLLACLPPEDRAVLNRSLQQATDAHVAKQFEEMQQNLPLAGYRIAGRRSIGDDSVILFLQTPGVTNLDPMPFILTTEGWKVRPHAVSHLITRLPHPSPPPSP